MTRTFKADADTAAEILVGHWIVETTDDCLVLDDGTVLQFETSNDDCCSSIVLTALHNAGAKMITAAEVMDNEDATGGEGEYRAWIHVVTEAGEFTVAEADGNASNGYYLHGFALSVTVNPPGTSGSASPVFQEQP